MALHLIAPINLDSPWPCLVLALSIAFPFVPIPAVLQDNTVCTLYTSCMVYYESCWDMATPEYLT